MTKKILFLFLLLLFYYTFCEEDQVKKDEQPTIIFTKEELQKFSHRQLRKMLRERGVKCKACVGANDEIEKIHLVNRVFETQHLPIKKKPKPPPPPPGDGPQPPFSMEPGGGGGGFGFFLMGKCCVSNT